MLIPNKVAIHYATDWSQYPALRKLGCQEPEPFVDGDPVVEGEHPLMIRCLETGLCFTVAEARGEHWIPSPDELIERRNAIRETWDDSELESRDVTQGATIQDREAARRCTIPMISTQGWDRDRKRIGGD